MGLITRHIRYPCCPPPIGTQPPRPRRPCPTPQHEGGPLAPDLETFALEEYKAGRQAEAELLLRLGFESRYVPDGFLKAHELWFDQTAADLDRERGTLEQGGMTPFAERTTSVVLSAIVTTCVIEPRQSGQEQLK